MHWAVQYIGKRWTPEDDCLYWFRRISRERFGRDVPEHFIDHRHLVRSAARTMQEDIERIFGYHETDTPREGDAVFLSQRLRPHHLGLYLVVDGKPHVLHALEGSGVICSDLFDLRANGWTIREYYTHGGTA